MTDRGQPALMIYGTHDLVARNERIAESVPNVTEVELDCGHWITEEMPEETTRAILNWLQSTALRSAGERAVS